MCGMDSSLGETVDNLIDNDPKLHDFNRLIINGHWLPESVFPEAYFFYNYFSDEGVKAMLLHHILDYIAHFVRDIRYFSYGRQWVISFISKLFENLEIDSKRLLNVEQRKLCQETRFERFISYYPTGEELEILRLVIKTIRELINPLRKCVMENINSILSDIEKEIYPDKIQENIDGLL